MQKGGLVLATMLGLGLGLELTAPVRSGARPAAHSAPLVTARLASPAPVKRMASFERPFNLFNIQSIFADVAAGLAAGGVRVK